TISLATGEYFSVAFDNGYINGGGSAGFSLRNASGQALWEFYFNGGQTNYTVNQNGGASQTLVPFTGDGLRLYFELTGPTSYIARIASFASGSKNAYAITGNLIAQADQGIAQLRCWNFAAGAGGNYDVFLNSLAVVSGT